MLTEICYSLRHDTAMHQVKFLNVVLKRTKTPRIQTLLFLTVPCFPREYNFSKDLNLS